MSKGIIPTAPEVARETLTLLAGALIAALIVSRVPALREFIRRNSFN